MKQIYSKFIRTVIATGSLCLFSLSVNASTPWQVWPAVGDARLTWGPWVIYDSELRSPDGIYQGEGDNLALVIRYHRNIDSEDLIEATDDQWRHLGISSSKRSRWTNQLEQIWPDVKKGDRLIFVMNGNQGAFFQGNRQIGVLQDLEMSQSFLHIWLSPNTAYPEIRHQLIGKR
ncbi:chalcone isomerase family protein [Photobacterium sp. ZSDE20]|uniref:Chalcone isomerase family protein n=1 Tax=Photobacterium pectinilyticum TaxID=2906793 RepID=A0ABT1N664_9GAMM|nr:chalcone isomerase family protein [Photobacterium sp. ZSDE20]MCQ1060231.1 chalcone isomerase family protein [Photobacterium sp. ZSDE20]MDD1827532.1 chalcone isomerase family protein [Photobacterium sp. ZSDE20]